MPKLKLLIMPKKVVRMAGLKAVQISDVLIMKWMKIRYVIGQPAADPVTENAVPKDI